VVLWDVAPGSVLEIAGVSEEHDTSIAKIDLRKDVSSTPLRSLGCLQDYKASHQHVAVLFNVLEILFRLRLGG
jgi:hypothetical protein